MASIAIALIVAYLTILVLMYVMQRSMQYFPDRARTSPEQAGLEGVREIELRAGDGTALIGWYAPAREGEATILFFHGNAGALANRAGRFAAYRDQGFGVFFAGYRGYGGSGGEPTEAGLLSDAPLFFDWLVEQGVPEGKIVIIGESLGSAIAVQLASQRNTAAVILEAPFSAAVDIAASHYWWLPVRLLMKDRYDSKKTVADIDAPLTIIHGEDDPVVPIRYGRTLFQAADEPKTFIAIAGARHNDLLREEVLQTEFRIVREAAGQ